MQRVLIFGSGKLYRNKENYIKKHFSIVGFLDNKVSDGTAPYEDTDIPVFNPKDVGRYLQDDVLIILMSNQYISMWKQLHGLGVGKEKILFGISFPPLSQDKEELFSRGRLEAEENNVVWRSGSGQRIIIETHQQLLEISRNLLREKYKKEYPLLNAIAQMDTIPISRRFGLERGSAIDRYYIEDFLDKNKELIYGDCLEIAENTYTLKYGGDRVENSYILHVEGWGKNSIKGNLETGEGIEENRFDSAIITQTLMFIFDIKKVALHIYKMLKKGGNALITVSGISQISRFDADLWGSYYSFHEDAMKALFEPLFGKENIEVQTYGNVKVAVAMLCGLCQEDLRKEDFEVQDSDYPVIISIALKKR